MKDEGRLRGLRRRIDVSDFGTPVSQITTVPQGDNVRMTVEARGLWEQTVYQSDTQLVIDVKPIKEDPNRLVQSSSPGYAGEKLSLNFQNVEVRAALQAIADQVRAPVVVVLDAGQHAVTELAARVERFTVRLDLACAAVEERQLVQHLLVGRAAVARCSFRRRRLGVRRPADVQRDPGQR